MVVESKRVKIGLLAPYSGTNLGDGAVQETVLAHLSRRIPEADFCGIYLAPKETEWRHLIRAFPITGLTVESYSSRKMLFGISGSSRREPVHSDFALKPQGADVTSETGDQASHSRGIVAVKERLKCAPLIGNGLRFAVRGFREARNIAREIRHLVRSYVFLRDMDLLIVSGSGQLGEDAGGPWGHPYALFRWALLARLTRTKFAVASVGTCTLKTALGRYFLRTALRTACYRSYRDRGSKELLNAWSFTKADLCIPDMGFSLDLSRQVSDTQAASSGASDRIVAVSPISYGNPECWPFPDPVAYNSYIDALAVFTKWLIQQGYSVLLLASSSSDRQAICDLRGRMKSRYGPEILIGLTEPSVRSFHDLLNQLRTANLVVASRLHAILLSHVLLKPVLAISWDRKIEAHMQDIQQVVYRLHLHGVDASSLRDTFVLLEANAHKVRTDLCNQIAVFRELLDRQYEHLVRLAKSERVSSTHGVGVKGE